MDDEDDIVGYYYRHDMDDYRLHSRVVEPSIRLDTYEFRPQPRTISVTWTRELWDNLDDYFELVNNRGRTDGTIKRKAEEHRRNSRKHRTIRI